ncbi:hypothetical protein, partial [Escherichia coli]
MILDAIDYGLEPGTL